MSCALLCANFLSFPLDIPSYIPNIPPGYSLYIVPPPTPLLYPCIFPIHIEYTPMYRIYPLNTPSKIYPLYLPNIPVYSPYIPNTPPELFSLHTEYTLIYRIQPYIPNTASILHPHPPTCRRYRYVFPPPTKYTLTYQTYALCMRNSPPTYRIHPNMPWNGSQTRPKESYAANKNEWGADKAFTELRPLFLTFSCPVSILVELVNLARQDGHLVSISAHRSRQWRQNMCPCPHTK